MSRLLLAGTIPHENLSLTTGAAHLQNSGITIGNETFPVNRGTAAMIGAACAVASFFGDTAPCCVVAGDIGMRTGSRLIYRHLIEYFPKSAAAVAALHYIVPDIALHNRMLVAVRKSPAKPVLIADAGFMYVAKAGNQAKFYELFLPDIGELAFLADSKTSHPAYTRGFLTRIEARPQELIQKAYAGNNASRFLCVKGKIDYICDNGAIIDTVDSPVIETLEPIGGTGDTITGMVAGLVSHGVAVPEACALACRANRIAGELLQPTPASQIAELIEKIPAALQKLCPV